MGKAKQTIKVTTRTRTRASNKSSSSGKNQSRCPTCGKYMKKG